uniref:Si:ch211-185a18.2 n=1 Tax=Erpetoichthys calabaricus TaxID=27687 RepID=A0A8C4SYV3_ERPCA
MNSAVPSCVLPPGAPDVPLLSRQATATAISLRRTVPKERTVAASAKKSRGVRTPPKKPAATPPALPANRAASRKPEQPAAPLPVSLLTRDEAALHGPQNPRLSPFLQVKQKDSEQLDRNGFFKVPPEGGNDVLISQYSAGQKEAVRAAIKNRSHGGPLKKEVKVQLLQTQASEKQRGMAHVKQDASDTADAIPLHQARALSSAVHASVNLHPAVPLATQGGSFSASGPARHQLPGNHIQDMHHGGPSSSSVFTAAKGIYDSSKTITNISPVEPPAPRRFAPVPMPKEDKLHSNKDKPGSGRPLEEIFDQDVPATPPTHFGKGRSAAMEAVDNSPDRHSSSRQLKTLAQDAPLPNLRKDAATHTGQTNCKHVLCDCSRLNIEMPRLLQAVTPQDDLPQLPQPSFLKKAQMPESMFEDVKRTLTEVEKKRRILEENLDAIMRARSGDILHSYLDALSNNRDPTEEVRIKKTVDAWINIINKQIQDEFASEENLLKKQGRKTEAPVPPSQKSTGSTETTSLKDVSQPKKQMKAATREWKTPSNGGIHKAVKEPPEKSTVLQKTTHRMPLMKVPFRGPKSEMEAEQYLERVYGKALYQGHRSSLKKGPYLRFSSPSPKSKPLRLRVVESVKGVKMKSARTQTSSIPVKTHVRQHLPEKPTERGVIESSSAKGPYESPLMPVAIPLGKPIIGGWVAPPAGSRPQKSVTVTLSVPPSPPRSQVKKASVAVVHMKSEQKEPPHLTVQVLPNVDIDSVSSESTTPTPPPAHVDMKSPVQTEVEEEPVGFPGSNFVAVIDTTQLESEDEGDFPKSIELHGDTGPSAAPYHGPVFPPPAAVVSSARQDLAEERNEHSKTLESQLVDLVEKEILAQVIAHMYPADQPPELDSNADEDSVASDIVEAAGGAGLQLFVDAGLPVDSDLIRQFVNKAVEEIVAIMLGQREGVSRSRTPPPSNSRVVSPISVIATPIPTPQQSPRHTPSPPPRMPTPVRTPDNSEEESTQEPEDTQDVSLHALAQREEEEAPFIVETPACTPVPSPRVPTPSSPSISEKTPSPVPSPHPSNAWENAELPLEEEDPRAESPRSQKPVEMSVAVDEEPHSPIPPLPLPEHSPSPEVPVLIKRTESPPESASSEESSASLSGTETETESAGRNISEGEILFSSGQMHAARAFAEEGVILPNHNESLSSSLRDAHDMDYDPPSEGQVIRKPHYKSHRDPVLSLLVKMNQGQIVQQQQQQQMDFSEDSSVGEVSEGQRPRLTRAAEVVMTGHSLLKPRPMPSKRASELRERRPASPGQCSAEADVGRDSVAFEGSQGPMSLHELEDEPGTVSQDDQVLEMSEGEHRGAPIQVKPYDSQIQVSDNSESPDEGIATHQKVGLKMALTLPSAHTEEQSESPSALESDTDTSAGDVF